MLAVSNPLLMPHLMEVQHQPVPKQTGPRQQLGIYPSIIYQGLSCYPSCPRWRYAVYHRAARRTNKHQHSHLMSIWSCQFACCVRQKPTKTQGGTFSRNSLNLAGLGFIWSRLIWDLVADVCSRVLWKLCVVLFVLLRTSQRSNPSVLLSGQVILFCAASIWTSSCCGYMNIVKTIILLTSQCQDLSSI